jgi:thymidine phosphorylase
MQGLGARAGRPTVCELTRMDEPLGHAVGNALEVAECVALLHGRGPADLRELVLTSAGRLLALSDLGVDEAEGRARAEAAIATGEALAALERWVAAQGGDPRLGAEPWAVLERAPVVREVTAPRQGAVARLSARGVAHAAALLGAARERRGDAIDHAVGVEALAKVGDRVSAGDPLARVHARDEAAAERAAAEVRAAYALADGPVERPSVLLETIA